MTSPSPAPYVPIPALPYGLGSLNDPYAMFNPMHMEAMAGFYAGRNGGNGDGRSNTNFQQGNRGNHNNYQRRHGDNNNYGGNSGYGYNRNNNGSSLTCQLCGKVSRRPKTCRTLSNFQQDNSSSDISCQYCGKNNHTAYRCFFLIGFPGQQQQNSSAHIGLQTLVQLIT